MPSTLPHREFGPHEISPEKICQARRLRGLRACQYFDKAFASTMKHRLTEFGSKQVAELTGESGLNCIFRMDSIHRTNRDPTPKPVGLVLSQATSGHHLVY